MSRYSDSSLMSGLGRMHHRRRVHRGYGFLDIIRKVLPFVKRSGVIGHLASNIPLIGGPAGTVARALGYGRKRRVHRRRRRLVGGIMSLKRAIRYHSGVGRRRVHRRRVRRHRGHGLLMGGRRRYHRRVHSSRGLLM